jgi:hypothetical protein
MLGCDLAGAVLEPPRRVGEQGPEGDVTEPSEVEV